MKNSSDTVGNRTRDLPACSAVSQPTAPPRKCIRNSVINLDALAQSNNELGGAICRGYSASCTIQRGVVSLMVPSIGGRIFEKVTPFTLARHAGFRRAEGTGSATVE